MPVKQFRVFRMLLSDPSRTSALSECMTIGVHELSTATSEYGVRTSLKGIYGTIETVDDK